MSGKQDPLRARIAARRDHLLFRGIATVCGKYLRAYNNEANWDVSVNGEANSLSVVTQALDGDVFDVGANIGQWATMALRVIGDKRLHCFEMVPSTYQCLEQKIGRLSQVTLNDIGLGCIDGTIDIHHCPEDSCLSSAFALNDGLRREPAKVAIRKGDDYINQKQISAISYLKIDVEGMEMDVLTGLSQSLRAGTIKAVQFEHTVSHVMSRHLLKDFVEFFAAQRFAIFRCYPTKLESLRYDAHRDENFIGANYVAIAERYLPTLQLD